MTADLCRRVGAAASLTGSIVSRGGRYVIGLETSSCSTGEPLIQEIAHVAGKEDVLAELKRMATAARIRLTALRASRALVTPQLVRAGVAIDLDSDRAKGNRLADLMAR
jgi:hypothetical protein